MAPWSEAEVCVGHALAAGKNGGDTRKGLQMLLEQPV
jgi:hypothetical protein